ncbi:hypothetical protein BDV24DRAFT_170558, partial [Aspergillus arachidicola]
MWLNGFPLHTSRKHRLVAIASAGIAFWFLNQHFFLLTGDSHNIERIDIAGFYNDGDIGDLNCERIRQSGHVIAQRSIRLDDNITQIASALASHPMVHHTANNENKSSASAVVDPSRWTQFAGSGTWLPEFKLYLVISRVVYTRPGSSWPTISFLRGQLFDETWNHLERYTIDWHGARISFPRIFEIPASWREQESFFGPEDPRVVIEEGVQGAEPIIVFNMISDDTGNSRAMWIHKPFSNFTTTLTILGEERKPVEKNWAPFFHTNRGVGLKKEPSEDLHFVYSFRPLHVLKCKINNGNCDWVFKQDVPEPLVRWHEDTRGEMRGGTNFVPVPMFEHSGVQIYIGLPRTHLAYCKSGATYRPEITVLSGFESSFHIAYASVATEFGHSVLHQDLLDNPCTKGNILIPSSIARWAYNSGEDIMSVSFSIADNDIRILRLH